MSITCPNVFYYSDADIALTNDKLEFSQVLTQQMTEVCEKYNLSNPFRKNQSVKKRNPDLAFEIESCDLLTLNYEYFKEGLCDLHSYLDKNHIIQKARSYQNTILKESNKIREVENLLVLIHSLMNSKSQHSFRIMYLGIEFVETSDEPQKATQSLLFYR